MTEKTEDARTQAASDAQLKHELFANERLIEHPKFGTVRLTRPTPREESMIAEARRKQYHKDLQDETILSRSELERMAQRRGSWSPDTSRRIDLLQTRVGQIMGLLDTVGYQSVEEVADRFEGVVQRLVEEFTGKDEGPVTIEAIHRYFNLDLVQNPADHKLIMDNAMSTVVDDLLAEGQLYRTQVELLQELATARDELKPLLVEQVRLFKDSVESRQDRVEELAKLYYCTGTPEGNRLWKNFDAMWDERPQVLDILMEELYFFERGISDAYRAILGRHGFTLRVPTAASSDDSPGTPALNSSGESVDSAPTSSSPSPEVSA